MNSDSTTAEISRAFYGTAPEKIGEELEKLRYAKAQLGKASTKAVEILFTDSDRQMRHFAIRGAISGTDLNASEARVLASLLRVIEEGELNEVADTVVLNPGSDPVLDVRRFYRQISTEVLRELVARDDTANDILATAARRRALERFETLINDREAFEEVSVSHGGPERAWQNFFQENEWIFGYGLSYQYLSSWDPEKLEQVTTGHSIAGRGKRVDALLSSVGAISALCFVEIKPHETALMQDRDHRPGVWAPSRALVEGVTQLQRTVDEATLSLPGVLERLEPGGRLTGERAYIASPRSILLIGTLESLLGDGPNSEIPGQFRSFELYRRSLTAPEILTYDELLARAWFIVDPRGR